MAGGLLWGCIDDYRKLAPLFPQLQRAKSFYSDGRMGTRQVTVKYHAAFGLIFVFSACVSCPVLLLGVFGGFFAGFLCRAVFVIICH